MITSSPAMNWVRRTNSSWFPNDFWYRFAAASAVPSTPTRVLVSFGVSPAASRSGVYVNPARV
jgi:hypothetical protein